MFLFRNLVNKTGNLPNGNDLKRVQSILAQNDSSWRQELFPNETIPNVKIPNVKILIRAINSRNNPKCNIPKNGENPEFFGISLVPFPLT
jgi:hypothetical protein